MQKYLLSSIVKEINNQEHSDIFLLLMQKVGQLIYNSMSANINFA